MHWECLEDAFGDLPLLVLSEDTNLVNLSNFILDPPASFLKLLNDSVASFLVIPVTSWTKVKSLLDGPQPIFVQF